MNILKIKNLNLKMINNKHCFNCNFAFLGLPNNIFIWIPAKNINYLHTGFLFCSFKASIIC